MLDNQTTIESLKKITQEMCEERDWDKFHNPKDLAIGIITEASELLEIFRFKSIDDINQIFNSSDKIHEINDEIADVFFFLIRLCQMNNIDLTEAFLNKIEKNKRKYPIDIFKGSNKKYSEVLDK